jgi:hypothetical protein
LRKKRRDGGIVEIESRKKRQRREVEALSKLKAEKRGKDER